MSKHFRVHYLDLDRNERSMTFSAKDADTAREMFRKSHPCAANGQYVIFQVEEVKQ